MNNVLFLGQYRGGDDGWSIAARRYLECLLSTKHNIAARPIYMAGRGGGVSKKIETAENNRLDKLDIVIQNVLPELLERHDCYNIGAFFTETSCLERTGWVEKINLMDEIWINSELEKQSLIESGVECKISIVPIPYKPQPKVKPLQLSEIQDKFVFYFVGEHTERKNIMAFVKAFHREFKPNERVSIVIKTDTDQLTKDINEWKQYSRLRKEYIPEVIVSGRIPEKELLSIHAACSCFVCTSRGEAFCLPMLDAIYYGNDVICTEGIFPSSMFNTRTVNSYRVPVDCKQPPIQNIYTAWETWREIDILDLQKKMRDAYVCKTVAGNFINKYSYEEVSNKMEELLCL